MESNVHVETPQGEVLKPEELETNRGLPKHNSTNDANENAAGPKANPDPAANGNLAEKDKKQVAEGPGTEVTDGEAG